MRMDTSQGFSAKSFLNESTELEISNVIYKYGEEKASRRIAKAIVEFRNHTLIQSTSDLVKIIESVLKRTGKKHPATKTFQAIRIHVNNELEHLEIALGKLSQLLSQQGVIAIISFHSLEDRIVKNFFKPDIQSLPKDIPINNVIKERFHCIKKKIKPTAEEIEQNPRSRSAVMRVYSKL
jgi:16S rRNA (cytosine1402-N4)-methyltransferase